MLATPADRLKSFWTSSAANRAFVVALASVLPLLVWWMGWFPGFLTSDSFDQWGQVQDFKFRNGHPAIHTFLIWMVTRLWDSVGAVTLLQVLAMAGLLALIAKRLTAVGVPWALAAGAAIFVSLLPAVGSTTIALWKDVPYTLAMMWVFTELLLISADRRAFWERRLPLIRLGIALGLMWVFRHNGFLTVAPFLIGLGIWGRRAWRRLVMVVIAAATIVIGTNYVLYPLLDVDRAAIEPGAVFISDVAASYRHEPGNFSDTERAYLETIAPLEVWRDNYDCHNSTELAFDEQFRAATITADPATFRDLVVKTYVRDIDTVAGHRWCAADYLFWPPQPADAFFFRTPFVMADNEFGIEFDPVSDRAASLTLDIVQWSETQDRLWLTWRPALVIWLAIATYLGVAWRRRLRVLLLGGGLLAAQLANVALTTPAQEFRFAFGLYVIGLMSAPLLWLVWRPGESRLADPTGKPLRVDPSYIYRRPTITNSL